MGIGLVIVVAEHFAGAIVARLNRRLGVPSWIIGEVVMGEKNVSWDQGAADPHDGGREVIVQIGFKIQLISGVMLGVCGATMRPPGSWVIGSDKPTIVPDWGLRS